VRSAPASTSAAPGTVAAGLNTTGSEFGVAEMFGDAIIRDLSSDKWDCREEALQSIEERLRHEARTLGEMSDRLPLYNACCCILRTAMNDKVAPVYFASCKLLTHLVSEYGQYLSPDDVQVRAPARAREQAGWHALLCFTPWFWSSMAGAPGDLVTHWCLTGWAGAPDEHHVREDWREQPESARWHLQARTIGACGLVRLRLVTARLSLPY
jgi:hypothetical protein